MALKVTASNWNGFCLELSKLSNKGKGDAFESLTSFYLQFHPVYKSKLNKVWLLKETPPSYFHDRLFNIS